MGEARRRKILGLPPRSVKSSLLKNQDLSSGSRGSARVNYIEEGWNDETQKWEPIFYEC
jgi:hypothetical protein